MARRYAKPRPQPADPEYKDFMRINDIVKKSKDRTKIVSLSRTMASRITDTTKAVNRAVAADIIARELIDDLDFDTATGLIEASEIFLKRAADLGFSITRVKAKHPFFSDENPLLD